MEILKVLGLVTHWFSFVVGVFSCFYVAKSFGASGSTIGMILGLMALWASTLCGWIVRYILVGKIPFLPFKK